MQIDFLTADAITSIAISCLVTAFGYGVLRAKVFRLEKDVSDNEKECVKREVFNEIVTGVRDDILMVRSDLKELLHLTRNHTTSNKNEFIE